MHNENYNLSASQSCHTNAGMFPNIASVLENQWPKQIWLKISLVESW